MATWMFLSQCRDGKSIFHLFYKITKVIFAFLWRRPCLCILMQNKSTVGVTLGACYFIITFTLVCRSWQREKRENSFGLFQQISITGCKSQPAEVERVEESYPRRFVTNMGNLYLWNVQKIWDLKRGRHRCSLVLLKPVWNSARAKIVTGESCSFSTFPARQRKCFRFRR